ncbi:MAG: hypothetical protein WBC26_04075 [Alphaproteobacteria bacterium]|nr:hypothetical protein [Alphaproteobacteria bacterium]
MYLWNINKLKSTLSTTGLSQKSCFLYVIITSTFCYGLLSLTGLFPQEAIDITIWDHVLSDTDLVFAVYGTYLFYRANGGENGKDFLERYISIGFVVSIRLIPLIVLSILGMAIYEGVTEGVADDNWMRTGPDDAAIWLFWSFLIWYKMISHTQEVANTKLSVL